MSLSSSESFSRGFARTATGLAATTSTVGATMQSGFLRDPDGRLVVKNV